MHMNVVKSRAMLIVKLTCCGFCGHTLTKSHIGIDKLDTIGDFPIDFLALDRIFLLLCNHIGWNAVRSVVAQGYHRSKRRCHKGKSNTAGLTIVSIFSWGPKLSEGKYMAKFDVQSYERARIGVGVYAVGDCLTNCFNASIPTSLARCFPRPIA